jgi:hypothetical protein
VAVETLIPSVSDTIRSRVKQSMAVDWERGRPSTKYGTPRRIRGTGGAAALLGLKPTTLEARMKKLGIRRRA